MGRQLQRRVRAGDGTCVRPRDQSLDASGTGHELLVWGGLTADQQTKPDRYEGAAYDPDTGAWRPLPASGLPLMELAAAAWTGREMVVFGAAAAGGAGPDVGAAYDPTTNRWRRIALTPLSQRQQMSSTWTGHELIV